MDQSIIREQGTYPYTLTEGITGDRQGMLIIENEKILEALYAI